MVGGSWTGQDRMGKTWNKTHQELLDYDGLADPGPVTALRDFLSEDQSSCVPQPVLLPLIRKFFIVAENYLFCLGEASRKPHSHSLKLII